MNFNTTLPASLMFIDEERGTFMNISNYRITAKPISDIFAQLIIFYLLTSLIVHLSSLEYNL